MAGPLPFPGAPPSPSVGVCSRHTDALLRPGVTHQHGGPGVLTFDPNLIFTARACVRGSVGLNGKQLGDTELQLQGSGGCVQGRVQTAEVLVKLTSFMLPIVASLSIQTSIFKAAEHHEKMICSPQSSGLDDLPGLRPYRGALR